ncbi:MULTISPECIES: hypothetical protein [Streptomyces]|uniref:hypothetical protein n=1 Tax=Streptomyces TaxID=1883 RepID=UPI00332D7518
MTASAVVVRRSALGRACPACLESRCAEPGECLYFLTSRPWADCSECAGSGWAGEDDCLSIFCWVCEGSGLNEFDPGQITASEISDRAKDRHSAHIGRLSALVGAAPRLEVAA